MGRESTNIKHYKIICIYDEIVKSCPIEYKKFLGKEYFITKTVEISISQNIQEVSRNTVYLALRNRKSLKTRFLNQSLDL